MRDRLGPGVGPCEQRRRPSVLGGADGRGDVEIDRARRSGWAKAGGDGPRARPPRSGPEGLRWPCSADPRERAGETELAAVAEHGHGARQLTGGRLQPAEPRQHRGPQAIAREVIDTARAGRRRKTRFAHARKQLLQQPGIAARGGVARRTNAGAGVACELRAISSPPPPGSASPAAAHGYRRPQAGPAAPGSPAPAGRLAARSATGSPSIRRARYVSQRRDDGSHQCRSSATSSDGPFLRDGGEQPVEAVDHRRGVGLALPRVVEDRAGWTRGARQPAPPGSLPGPRAARGRTAPARARS